jgi:hypothetical protein
MLGLLRRQGVQLAAMLLALLGTSDLVAPVRVLSNGEPIVVDHATPYVVDWDGDGRRDLLVGQYGEGNLRLYRNRGTDTDPGFNGFEYVQAGGSEARVPVW